MFLQITSELPSALDGGFTFYSRPALPIVQESRFFVINFEISLYFFQ